MQDGFILIDKEPEWSSRDVCNKVQHIFHTKKVGHIGTLDPFATGLLIVSLNKATKAGHYLEGFDKTYVATLKLGIKTDTGDLTGNVVEKSDVPILTTIDIENALNSLLGTQEQIPPMTSAVHYNGKKLYEYAHVGITVERKPRIVNIISLNQNKFENDEITFTAKVSSGTYIRTLGETIAEKLNTCGHLISLRRIEMGPFKIDDSYVKINDVSEANIVGSSLLLKEVLPTVKFSDEKVAKVKTGISMKIDIEPCEKVLIISEKNEAVAVYYYDKEKDIFVSDRGLW